MDDRRVEVLKFVHPSASDLKGFVFLDFRKKIAEHCLFFIVQPCVISWPSFLESSVSFDQ